MREFTLYGFNAQGRVILTETFTASSPGEARERGASRLELAEGVEVWEGSVLVLRAAAKVRRREP